MTGAADNGMGGDEHTLPTSGPFNLEVTARLLQRRPANRVDRWDDDRQRYLRAVETADGFRLLTITNTGTIDEPDVQLRIEGGPVGETVMHELEAMARWILGLDAAPAPVDWLTEVEPQFGPVAHALRGFRPPCFPTLFETCASVLPFQQLSLDAGIAILGRLVERYGESQTLAGVDRYAFPGAETIATIDPVDLREIGFSLAKAKALHALAEHAAAGELEIARFQALPTETALKELRRLPGIGLWSAGLILLRGLRRMDVFPPGDVGAARNLTEMLDLPVKLTPAETIPIAERFGDRQGYLYFLGLGAQLVARGLISEMSNDAAASR